MIVMDNLIEKLNKPFDGLTKNDIPQIQKRCQEIAELLFKGYGIKCGKRIFQFAEIEFYYYKKEVDDIHNFDAPWNKETYPRQKNAGDLFFHYSGVDICFQCNFEEKEKMDEYGEYGGILIRSIREGDKVLAGPLFCVNAILNACENEMPQLVQLAPNNNLQIEYKTDTRCGISSDQEQEEGKKLFLCYYVTHVDNEELIWSKVSERIAWDKKNGKFKASTRNYQKERPLK